MFRLTGSLAFIQILLSLSLVITGCGDKGTNPTSPSSEGRTLAARFDSDAELDGWFGLEDGAWNVTDGRLLITGVDETFATAIGPDQHFDGDIDVSVNAEYIDGGEPGRPFGLQIRVGPNGGYGIGVTPSGVVLVNRWDVRLGVQQPTRLGDQMDIEPEATITLRAVTRGGTLDFYADGQMVVSIEDSTYKTGRIGLIVARGQVVAFDDLLVTAFLAPSE